MSTKLVSDAFLPSGGLDINVHHHPSRQHQHLQHLHSSNRLPPAYPSSHYYGNLPSILSPLSNGLPPSTLSPPNEDLLPSGPFAPYSPPSGHPLPSRGPPLPQSANLNPNVKSSNPNAKPSSYPSNPSDPNVNAASNLYRSVSADATSLPTSHTPNHLVQRLAQQNGLIREAWEAERNYLEANRRRAEEVYQEERVIMEEVREAWENEKAALLRENQTLKERIQRLEGENATLRAVAAQQGVHAPGIMSPLSSQHGGSVDTSVESGPTAQTLSLPPQNLAPVADPSSLPPGLDGASRRPHRLSPGSSRTSPLAQPESSPFIPLDPRMQPQTQNPRDFLSREVRSKDESVPVIDVQELDPRLEGIPLKATAVQKFTFGESNKSSPATSPPPANDSLHPEPQLKRLSSKDHTFQVLQAEESRRLTMHAGHTPNHSLSLFPTMSVAEGSTGGGTVEDGTTPSRLAPSAPPEEAEEEKVVSEPVEEPAEETESAHHEHVEFQDEVQEAEDEPKEQFKPTSDVRLKGPLMVKNIPAQDEIFWDQVNKKLEPISLGQDSLPTVMRSSMSDDGAGPSGTQNPFHQPAAVAVGGDASQDARGGIEDAEEEVSGEKGVEGDIPLKIRTTTNFGAPFGVA